MKKIFKVLSILFAFACLFTLASCDSKKPVDNNTGDSGNNDSGNNDSGNNDSGNNDSGNNDSGNNGSTDSNKLDYVVEVKSINGKPIKDCAVIFKQDGKTVKQGTTGKDGTITYNLDKNIYNVSVIPAEGYSINSISSNKTDLLGSKIEVVCDAELISSDAPAGTVYTQGDIMYDFTLENTKGDKFNLATLLETKKAVILNFWYADCYWCNQEFPFMQEAYSSSYKLADATTRKYSEDIAILAVNPGIDDNATINNIKSQYGITFDMVLSDKDFASYFSVTAFPTTVIIDRYGLVAEIEGGAITSALKWTDSFDTYISDEYVPKWDGTTGEDGSVVERPKPTIKWPEAGVLESVACGTNKDGSKFEVTFRPEDNKEDAEYSWPWIVSEDGKSIIPSNELIDGSFSMLYFDVTLKENQTLVFDYLCSTEEYDVLYVIVNNSIATSISGISPNKEWEKSYAYTAIENDEYEFCLCYMKDGSTSTGDDKIYINNMRIVDSSDIDKETYIFRECATGNINIVNDTYAKYVTVVYNEEDGYYHVGTKTGPLLLADLISGTNWNGDSLYEMSIEENIVVDGVNYHNLIETYASYANNSSIGYTPVTEELAQALKVITKAYGSAAAASNANQWLELCVYYSAYGTGGKELANPIVGLAPFAAYQFNEYNEASATFDRVIVPRGYVFEFTPTTSGVYKFYSKGELKTDFWLFDSEMNLIAEANNELRSQFIFAYGGGKDPNFVSYNYYEAGTTYYVRACFYDIYEFSTITIAYEYVTETTEILNVVSSGYFTSSDDEMSDIITGGIDVELGADGLYHVTKGAKEDNSLIYCDLTVFTSIFSQSIMEMLELSENPDTPNSQRAFDFRYDELGNPLFNADGNWIDENGNVLVDENGNPISAANGDATAGVRAYIDAYMVKDETSELYGMVVVDEAFAGILQSLMDKYTFAGVDKSWTKLCYYFMYLGPVQE